MTQTMKQILELGKDADKFHPDVVSSYREFIADISKGVDLNAVTESDVKEFLSKWEFEEYEHSLKRLSEWLEECKLTNDSGRYLYSFPVWGVFGFKDKLLKVYAWKQYHQMEADAQNRARLRAYQKAQQNEWERKQAIAEHQQWTDRLNKSLDTLKANLSKNTKPKFQTPAWLKSYSPSVWVKQLSGPTYDWFNTNDNIPIAANKETLEEALRNHVDVRYFYNDYYIPSVQYEAVSPPPVSTKGHLPKAKPGVPCLKWRLATYIISIAEFHLDDGTIPDLRYGYNFKGKCDPEKLGTVYSGPELWKYQDAFVTPVSLLALLAWGKSELPGVETVKRDAPWNVYRVAGFSDEVILHDDFVLFIRDMVEKTTLDKALLDRGMCDKETALLIKQKMDKLKEPEAPAAGLPKSKGPGNETGDDFQDMVTALAQMGFKNREAIKAAKSVFQESPHETLVDKIKLALKYLGQ